MSDAAASGSSRVSLHRRPKATTYSIEDLVAEVLLGRIRVPHFQRGLAWGPSDVRDLFDSVWRGFPIGTLLFWRQPVGAARLSLGTVEVSAPAFQDGLAVVDGQQRITSLVSVLTSSPRRAGSMFELWFDPETSDFVRPRIGAPVPDGSVPLDRVLDSGALVRWLHELGSGAPSRAARELGQVIRDYQIPAYEVDDAEERVVRTIFDRVNSSGKPLTAPQVFHALHSGGAEPDGLAAVAESVAAMGFGDIEEKLLLRGFEMAMRLPPGSGTKAELNPDRVREGLQSTKRGLEGAVQFIQGELGILRRELIPYAAILPVLIGLFARFPDVSRRDRNLLSRWAWRGFASGALRADVENRRRAAEALAHGDASSAVQAMLRLVPSQAPSEEWSLPKHQRGSARVRIEILTLLWLGPLDLETGAPVDVGELVADEKRALPRIVDVELPEADTTANRLLHPRLRGRDRMLERLVAASPEVRQSHVLDDEAVARLQAGDHEAFLRARADRLRERVQLEVVRRAVWDPFDNDRPALSVLLGPEESDD